MSRLSLALIAAVLAVGFGSVQLAQSQTEDSARRADHAEGEEVGHDAGREGQAQGRAQREAEGDDAGRESQAEGRPRRRKRRRRRPRRQSVRSASPRASRTSSRARSCGSSCRPASGPDVRCGRHSGDSPRNDGAICYARRAAAAAADVLVSPRCWPQSMRMHSPVIVVAPSTKNSAATATSYGQMPRLSGYAVSASFSRS